MSQSASQSGTRRKRRQARGRWALATLALLAISAYAGTSLQPGVFYHEPPGIELRLSDVRSGAVCTDASGPANVCETATKIVITGQDRCNSPAGEVYPCTRFGYEFDYQGAAPGTAIDCTVTRRDPMARKSTDAYTLPLNADGGHIFRPGFRPYGPVEQRAILTEVHDCRYQGQPLVSIEYLIYYEPGTPPPAAAAPGPATPAASPTPGAGKPVNERFNEIPDACQAPYLAEAAAAALLGAEQARRSGVNERVPNLVSQCTYTAGGPAREVGTIFKFYPTEMFDVDSLDPMQLQFNASFIAGGAEFRERRTDLGRLGFVFEQGKRSVLLIITGIQGPPDGAQRSTEFIALYYLDRPELGHAERRDLLIDKARQDLRGWGVAAP